MENLKSKELESEPKDITNEFLTMSSTDFLEFLRTQKKEPALSITITWDDNNPKLSDWTLVRLKAFLEDSDVFKYKQKRFAKVCATETQKKGPLSKGHCANCFCSGVKWEKIPMQ